MLDAIIRRLKNTAEIAGCITTNQICDDAVTTPKILDDNVTAPKIGPDSINDMDHDHIDPDWSQWGGISSIAVDVPGWFTKEVTYPQAFTITPTWLLTSIASTSPCQPSGLKVFLYPCNITASSFTLNTDVNVSCASEGATIDVSWHARTMPEAWIS